MTEMQQILAGVNELNERVHNAEARATGAERPAQATQQEFARSQQAGAKGKGNIAAVPLQQEQGICAFASKYQPQPVEGEDDMWRECSSVLQLFWTIFGGALEDIFAYVEGLQNDSATIIDLALTTLGFDSCLVRNMSMELYHVLIMLTTGRAQRLVLKAAEPEELEAYRLLFRRYEPISSVTTVFEPCGFAGNHVQW